MNFLASYLSPYKGRMALGLSIKVVGTLVELVLPAILTHILENVIVTLDVRLVVLWGAVMIVCAAVACVCNITANRMAARVSRDFSKKMRRDLFAKTLTLSARQTDRFTIPSLESRITSDTYNVHSFVNMAQRMGVRAPMLLVGGLAISFFMDSYLALVMLAMLPVIFVIVYLISRNGIPLYSAVQTSVDSMVRVVREDTQGIRVIKALSKNDYENRRYEKVNSRLSHDERRAGIVMGVVNPVMTLLMNLGIAAVVALSAYRVSRSLSSPATVIAFIQYFTLISMAMLSISRIFVMLTKCSASAKRIAEVLGEPDEFFVSPCEATTDADAPHVSFKDVSFSYFGRQKNLDGISFDLPRGSSLGIIGATGSGKTTLIRLLLRAYEPGEGEIKISGRPLCSYGRGELSSMIGASLQNGFLYSDTIEENISFGRDIPKEDIVRAAKIAQADEFIASLEGGYSHVISPKGTNLSGGQRQRILIARALAARPEILILDDSSSALDYKTDAALRAALARELTGTTFITVAQRVSSIKNCDRIIVLDGGRAIGYGTHEELLQSCSVYKEISDSQMGGAFVE